MKSGTFDLSVILKMVDQLTSPLKRIGVSFSRFNVRLKSANKNAKNFDQTLKSLGNSMRSTGQKMSKYLTAPLMVLNTFAFKAAVDFETAWTGVLKTVDASEAELAKLQTGLRGLALQIPLATEEVFGIAEAAGQLGIETGNIQGFAKVMADLGATTNLSAREAATSLARLANITNMSQDQFDRLGSTIVHLGNNLATTEAEIVNMGLRLAGAGNLIGLTEAQILGLAGALSSLGIRAESGGTAFSQVMRKIDKEVGTGSDIMWGFAKISKKSVKEFETLWEKDAISALQLFIKGIGNLEKKGINVNQVLDALGLDGIRISDSLLRASGSSEKFAKGVEMGSVAWKQNIALIREANLRYKTAASRIKMFWEEIKQLAESFGVYLLPAIQQVSDFFLPMIKWLRDLSPETKKTIVNIAAFAAAIGPLLIALGAVLGTIGGSLGLIAIIGSLLAFLAPLLVLVGLVAIAFIELAPAIKKGWKELKIFGGWLKTVIKDIKIFFDWVDSMQAFRMPGLIGGFGGFGGGNPLFARREAALPLMSAHQSQTDVRLRVSADPGSSVTVERVQSKGPTSVKVIAESYLGTNLAHAH
jgi:TP901 family phage tail tape measure protein